MVKRHNFKTQDATHGNSLAHRAPGSIGQCQFPGRVFKGKKMAGHMGDRNTTVQNLEIERIDMDENVLLVKGAVPGSVGSFVKVTPSIKDGAKLSLEPIIEEIVETNPETEEVVESAVDTAESEQAEIAEKKADVVETETDNNANAENVEADKAQETEDEVNATEEQETKEARQAQLKAQQC